MAPRSRLVVTSTVPDTTSPQEPGQETEAAAVDRRYMGQRRRWERQAGRRAAAAF